MAPTVHVSKVSPSSKTTLHRPPSPFLPPAPLHPPALGAADNGPDAFDYSTVAMPENATEYESPYTTAWSRPTPARKRTKSWHGPALSPRSPSSEPKSPAFLDTPSSPRVTHGLKKSRSFGNTAAPGWVISPSLPPQIHPWLNGNAPSNIFYFDLAPTAFLPLRLATANPPQSTLVSTLEMREPAFHPARTALRIIHPKLPFWPVDIALPSSHRQKHSPPIALGDILVALHRALHTRITAADWAMLSAEDAARVNKAFSRRCRAEAVRSRVPMAQLRDREVAVRNDGVKRVDFLMGKTVFKGLMRAPGDPDGCVLQVTAYTPSA
ncbi:hypothetical protein C8R43DRAFT_991722 [Mycena crocata]|nr:hypothetical protein C8R43DRAFT_991722 [Mycena crocata]